VVLYQKKDFSRIVCMLRSGGNARSETFKAAMVQAKKMQAYCELKVIRLTIGLEAWQKLHQY
jgi:bloom syndrome protein